jgi:TM2 domain-containing membrane protein YozV
MTAANSAIILDIFIFLFGLVISGSGALMLAIARKLIRGEISRKRYMGIGFKIKEAFASDEAWYRINRDGAKLMVVPSLAFVACGVLLALCPFFFPSLRDILLVITFACIIMMILVLAGYVIWVRRSEPGRKAA